MKKTKHLLWISMAALGATAQNISPSVLNSTGGSNSIGNNVYEWSFGEMTLVDTYTSPNLILTQGVLQNNSAVTIGIASLASSLLDLSVYPNPSQDFIHIKSSSKDESPLSYVLTDVSGKKIQGKEGCISSLNNEQTVSLQDLPSGVYFLQIADDKKGSNHSKTFQIQKIN